MRLARFQLILDMGMAAVWKGSKATKSDCLDGYEGFPRQEQDKENL